MAVTATDPHYQAHYRTWLGFIRFVKIMIVLIIIVLGGLALFVA